MSILSKSFQDRPDQIQLVDVSLPRQSAHRPFLEGMRGIAALYVVFSHLRVHNLPVWASALKDWANYGHAAVGVFIVLSGYCLMLPVAQSSEGELRGGWQNYLLRRAKRILPPYYIALLLSLPIEYFHQHNHSHSLDIGALVSHVFLLHNLTPRWNQALDGPMWSVATEWQIYFFLPLLLLPLWRRFGMIATAFTAFAIGFSPHFLLHPTYNFDWACPWYIGLFSLGIWGAVITDGATTARRDTNAGATSWLVACIALLIVVIGEYHWFGTRSDQYVFAIDPFVGLCAMCLIVACTKATREKSNSSMVGPILLLFQTRVALRLGAFSYSLYLTHSLIYYSAGWLIARRIHSPVVLQIAHYLVLLPLMLIFAYGFYLLFERPLMQARNKPFQDMQPTQAQVTGISPTHSSESPLV